MIDNFELPEASEMSKSSEQVCWADELERLATWKSFPEDGKIIHSTDADRDYKARHGWFENVITIVGSMELEGLLEDEESQQAAKTLYEKFTNEEFKGRLTTPEDIRIADECNEVILRNYKERK